METDAAVEKLKNKFFHRGLQNPAGFRTVSTGSATINLKQQNRTLHLLQKPDTFICYRHERKSKPSLTKRALSVGAVRVWIRTAGESRRGRST
jgi:hypothetical protein